ncbi:MAG: hypothetical protein IT497_01660 [Ottowia sp.]|nr:hypothetical protein [Ottowia sp.]
MQVVPRKRNLLSALFSILTLLIFPTCAFAIVAQQAIGSNTAFPTFPLNLGEKSSVTFGERTTNYQFIHDRVLVKANAGWGYVSQGTGIVGLDFASLVGDSAALGLNLSYQQDKLEAVIHHMKYWLPLGWRWKGSLSYMQGRQQFNFLQTSEKAKLSQLTYYGAIDWLNTSNLGAGIQSVGLATWGGKSKNHSQFEEQEYAVDTQDYFLITRDHRWLSEGRLLGTALSFQYVPNADFPWIFKGSVGQEWLKYPYMNGGADNYRNLYLDGRLDYQLNRLSAFNLGYKYGVVENRMEVGWRYSYLGLSGFYSQGRNGLDNQYGALLNVDILALLSKPKRTEMQAANNILPVSHAVRENKISPTELLQETILRPIQLPIAFMVKVDPTGVKHFRVEKAGLPNGSFVTSQGNIYIPVTQGPSVIFSALVNGQPVSGVEGKFNTQANQLVVITKNLPDPVSMDDYVVDIEDSSTGTVYRVSFELVIS